MTSHKVSPGVTVRDEGGVATEVSIFDCTHQLSIGVVIQSLPVSQE